MNLLFPECAGASLHKYKKCPRCGATRKENCLDDAAYKALLIRRNGTVPGGQQSCPTPGACSATAIINYLAAEIARLRAELAAAEAAAWQPIATAPRDGTWILGWSQRDFLPFRISWGRNHRGDLAWCSVGGSFVDGYITHWRPLPIPPAAENGAALRSRGLGDVLGDLAALGYDAEWHCIPASAVGAPHRRDRVWIVGHSNRTGCQGVTMEHGSQRQETFETEWSGGTLADAPSGRRGKRFSEPCEERQATRGLEPVVGMRGADGAIPSGARLALGPGTLGEWAHAATTGSGWWAADPDVGRVVDGISNKMDRRKRLIGLGNAVVPQIPELIGRAIMARLPDIRSEDE